MFWAEPSDTEKKQNHNNGKLFMNIPAVTKYSYSTCVTNIFYGVQGGDGGFS